jgi:hypothetical protein
MAGIEKTIGFKGRGTTMSARKAHHIWIEQCEAAQTIKARFGLTAAFDYLVGEAGASIAQDVIKEWLLQYWGLN